MSRSNKVYVEELEKMRQERHQAEKDLLDRDLLAALKKAREYVANYHSVLASAAGHEETIVKPDLDYIDQIIAKAEGRE